MFLLQATFLSQTAAAYSLDCISLGASDIGDSLNKLLISWNFVGETSCYVTSRKDEDFFSRLNNLGWRIICISEYSYSHSLYRQANVHL